MSPRKRTRRDAAPGPRPRVPSPGRCAQRQACPPRWREASRARDGARRRREGRTSAIAARVKNAARAGGALRAECSPATPVPTAERADSANVQVEACIPRAPRAAIAIPRARALSSLFVWATKQEGENGTATKRKRENLSSEKALSLLAPCKQRDMGWFTSPKKEDTPPSDLVPSSSGANAFPKPRYGESLRPLAGSLAGGCHCGCVRFEVRATRPKLAVYCHCRNCQRSSGGVGPLLTRALKCATVPTSPLHLSGLHTWRRLRPEFILL